MTKTYNLKLVGTPCSIFNIFLDNHKKIEIDVNAQDNHGYTPLHCACRSSSVSKYVHVVVETKGSQGFSMKKNLKKIVINMSFEKHFYRCSLVCSKLHRPSIPLLNIANCLNCIDAVTWWLWNILLLSMPSMASMLMSHVSHAQTFLV